MTDCRSEFECPREAVAAVTLRCAACRYSTDGPMCGPCCRDTLDGLLAGELRCGACESSHEFRMIVGPL